MLRGCVVLCCDTCGDKAQLCYGSEPALVVALHVYNSCQLFGKIRLVAALGINRDELEQVKLEGYLHRLRKALEALELWIHRVNRVTEVMTK